MKVKLINNQITYPSNFMKIGENWVSNPTDEMLVSEGYKELVYQEVDVKTVDYEETENEIIVYSEKPVLSELTEVTPDQPVEIIKP